MLAPSKEEAKTHSARNPFLISSANAKIPKFSLIQSSKVKEEKKQKFKALSMSPKQRPQKGARLKKKVQSFGNTLQTYGFHQITEEIKRRAELAKSKPKDQNE